MKFQFTSQLSTLILQVTVVLNELKFRTRYRIPDISFLQFYYFYLFYKLATK